ncbi:transposase [Streptomyces sp. NPDC001139]
MVGDGESNPFWTTFLRTLLSHDLYAVILVLSDSHSALGAAIRAVFVG